jgi:hypothetical protein
MPEAPLLFLMLIKISESVRNNPSLRGWINEIEGEYMDRFGAFGPSVAHLILHQSPWDFALVFPGSEASVRFLTEAIESRAPGQTEILTLQGRNLDDFRAAPA